ncbi:hypothetical protein BCE_3418 [Bacillus cereus ATCC 10987]|uniref:Uncharacterized protein n=1 Tax=Bacillus cereus (strain ATCC 10987 / NRS 248) TaxID=222523 RepID=Q734I7_BACC1|nr:hypothetical protein BCE_3418 [Bacillus cereus ATCC 10987]
MLALTKKFTRTIHSLYKDRSREQYRIDFINTLQHF